MRISDVFVQHNEATMDGGPFTVGETATLSLGLVCTVPIRSVEEKPEQSLLVAADPALEPPGIARYRATGEVVPTGHMLLQFDWLRLIDVCGVTVMVHALRGEVGADDHPPGRHITIEGTMKKVEGYMEDIFEESVQSAMAAEWYIDGITPVVESRSPYEPAIRGERIETTGEPPWFSECRGFLFDLRGPIR